MRAPPWLVVSGLVAAGCGGGGGGGEPLISGSMTGSYDGDAFIPDTGVATTYMGESIVLVGDGGLDCGSPEQNDPPPGSNALMSMPALDVGTYANVLVNLYHNVDGFEGAGSNMGTVTITASSAASVAGMVAYAYTDDLGAMYALSGTFEVLRCAP